MARSLKQFLRQGKGLSGPSDKELREALGDVTPAGVRHERFRIQAPLFIEPKDPNDVTQKEFVREVNRQQTLQFLAVENNALSGFIEKRGGNVSRFDQMSFLAKRRGLKIPGKGSERERADSLTKALKKDTAFELKRAANIVGGKGFGTASRKGAIAQFARAKRAGDRSIRQQEQRSKLRANLLGQRQTILSGSRGIQDDNPFKQTTLLGTQSTLGV